MPLTTGGSVNFLTVRNSQNILVAIIPVLLLGLGQTFVIIAAGIDLSVGWVMSLASVLSALALRSAFNGGVPLFPSIVIGLIAAIAGAAAVGLVNGVIIAKLKVPAFIVTLGTSFIVRGIAYLMSENTTVIGLPPGIRAYGNDALLYFLAPALCAAQRFFCASEIAFLALADNRCLFRGAEAACAFVGRPGFRPRPVMI